MATSFSLLSCHILKKKKTEIVLVFGKNFFVLPQYNGFPLPMTS